MENFEETQKNFIRKLEKVQGIFREIKDKDRRRILIQHAARDNFENLVRKNERMIAKLKKREFTVAIVGLEKAGKSTLANALLNLNVLPEYTERCTYTTTEIRAGSTDTAEIFFYGREQFERNFLKMLREIGYSAETTFEDFNFADFERYWRNVKNTNPALFQQHNGQTVEDIKAMVADKDAILYLVGREPEILNIEDADDYEKFHRYVTGFLEYRAGYVERTAEPYAVEKIIIKSTGLQDMQNIILYDVPGFDSPTDLHKKQTEEILKMSDAIILVTNVGDRPNLTGTQLDMLQKGRDEDEIILSEKLFVFGNKMDMAGNAQLARDNAAALIHDAADKYSIAQSNRIVCGSAKAYLEVQGKLSQDDRARGLRNVSATLASWGMADGVEDLKSKLRNYYDEDRFIVLKKRAEKNILEAKNFLNAILSGYSSESAVDDGGQYLLQAKDSLEEFSRKVGEISREYITNLQAEKPFSSLIKNDVAEIFPYENTNSVNVLEAENTGKIGGNYALSRVDALIREQLSFTFQKNIIAKTAAITLEKEEEIYQRMAEVLLESLKMNAESSYRQELEISSKNLFKSLLIENGEHCYFNPLIERYMLGLFEVLIKSPYASPERLRKLTDAELLADFQALSVYYPLENVTADFRQKYFFARMLVHDEISPPDVEENENNLRQFFAQYQSNLATGFDVENLPFKNWATLLAKLGLKISETDLLDRLKKALIIFVGNATWASLPPISKNRKLEEAILDYCIKLQPVPLVDYVKNLHAEIRGIENKDEMITILNEDIEILREFTVSAVIQAVSLERVFSFVTSKNIDMIRESISTEHGQEIFNRWLKENMRKIREDEYAAINRNLETFRDKQAIAESIRQVLNQLD